MNRHIAVHRIAAALLALPVSLAIAQPDLPYRPPGTTAIYGQAVAFASDQPGRSRVDIYAQVPYNELTFISDDGAYLAKFELAVQIRAADGQQVWQKSQTIDVRVNTFAQTVSDRQSNLRQLSVTLIPGTYDVEILMTDAESKRAETLKRHIVVRDFERDSLAVSDVLLVSKVTKTENRTNIVPNVSGALLRQAETCYLFFEIYRRSPLDSAAVAYRILDRGGNTVARSTRVEPLAGSTSQFIWKVDSVGLTAGQYRMMVEVAPIHRRDSSSGWSTASCPFFVNWESLPTTIRDIDKAVDQLRYIAKDEDMEFIRQGKDPDERKKRFQEFWQKRDPDPRTAQNELMEEYYARVSYSNEHFSHFVDGWRTDMGMVYIRFGPPENIERHPFETDTRPYEVWYYYQLNRQFIFVDRNGFGDYRLNYPDLDLWGRIR